MRYTEPIHVSSSTWALISGGLGMGFWSAFVTPLLCTRPEFSRPAEGMNSIMKSGRRLYQVPASFIWSAVLAGTPGETFPSRQSAPVEQGRRRCCAAFIYTVLDPDLACAVAIPIGEQGNTVARAHDWCRIVLELSEIQIAIDDVGHTCRIYFFHSHVTLFKKTPILGPAF